MCLSFKSYFTVIMGKLKAFINEVFRSLPFVGACLSIKFYLFVVCMINC